MVAYSSLAFLVQDPVLDPDMSFLRSEEEG